MAPPTPRGRARHRVTRAMMRGLMMAGSMLWFSVVKCRLNSSGFRFGTPLMRISPTR